jgi:shikimate 5-dehydrogenase
MRNHEKARIETRSVPTMEFIGVSTQHSSIMKVFPRWVEALGLGDAQLVGRDLPLHAESGLYREAVEQFRQDPLSVGALVTAHKVNLLSATRDLFDELDFYAKLSDEVSSISKRNGRLVGHAKDPITAGKSMQVFLEEGYFGRTGGQVLCLGAGGSGTAISIYLMTREDPADRPERIVMVNRGSERLEALKEIHGRLDEVTTEVEYIENEDSKVNDELMASLPAGSMVVNATGMGKDILGSPITDDGRFPENGIAWELNYRGELDFLHQARQQEQERDLTVEDGWLYFVHGWSEVTAEVFNIELTPETFQQLESEAEIVRK